MKTYDAYKPSRIDWIGDIPKHWSLKKLKYLVSLVDEKTDSTDFLVAVENIEGKTGKLKPLEVENTYQGAISKFTRGDTIFNKLRPYLAKVYFAENAGGCIGELLILRSKGELHPKFLFYRMLSASFIDVVDSSTNGIKMPRANWEDFISHLVIPYPEMDEQDSIASYLDEKTGQIDRLIANKQRLIDLLKEERRAIINQAVTKGINANAELKPSCIYWLGNIPDGWRVLPLKYIVSERITDGPHETPQLQPNGVPFISAEAVKDGRIDFNFRRGFISKELDLIYSKKCKPKRNDIFIVKSGATTGKIAIVDCDIDFNIWSPLALVRTNEKDADAWFVYYALQADYFQDQIKFSWSIGTQPNIGMGVIENLKVIIPEDLVEQKSIITFIEGEMNKIDSAIRRIGREIELLQDYRTVLISEAVTGKIKVV